MTTKSQSPLKSVQKNKIINLININSLHTNTQGACGYCQGKTPDRYWVTSGFECDQMGLQEYKQLLDRGWRRCGQYYYKPHIESCCCQPYPIRTNILQFKALQRNSFKERIKKLDKFLNYQENNYQNEGKKQKLNDTISSDSQHEEDNEMENDEIQKIKEYQKDINEYYQQMYCILVQFHKCMQEFYPKYEKQFQELLKTDKDLKHQLNIMWEVGPTTLKKTDNIKYRNEVTQIKYFVYPLLASQKGSQIKASQNRYIHEIS
ncbi:hypothetical protein PPERSA_10047 [Pseudocohnilembus persalinus]|uniref:N-end aminoacyl transferase N-terminal domain-containing protein n=1 Tax=Pseudocohnilembus persalinus TaxID=266149 RepID=A0A0V0QJK0_PSEPJ|nr:hypothetical protein PPERSA_10047 [Pseudocohnilembus persalinus]|eukprot:KRX02430.1 hypothetical protein PPERSA_10047 [Pseudocohnilembus persalinus]